MGIGFGLSIVILAGIVKFLFLPFQIYTQKTIIKSRQLGVEMSEFSSRMNKLKMTKNIELMRKEKIKLGKFRKTHGIGGNPLTLVFSFLQGITLISWAALIQQYTYKLEDYPQMVTGGFFWFKDLSQVDPYCILPFFNCLFIAFNISRTKNLSANNHILKFRRVMLITPIFTFGIMTTFQTGFVLYMFSMSFLQTLYLLLLNTKFIQKYTGDGQFIDNTKIERVVYYIYIFYYIYIYII